MHTLHLGYDEQERRSSPYARFFNPHLAPLPGHVLEALSSGAGPRRVLVTLGYSGWAAGQLEEEIGRNGWITVDASPDIIFDTPVEQRYERALALLGIDPRMLSSDAGHA